MTDLPIFPEAYLSSAIVKKTKLNQELDLYVLANGDTALIKWGVRDIIINPSELEVKKTKEFYDYSS